MLRRGEVTFQQARRVELCTMHPEELRIGFKWMLDPTSLNCISGGLQVNFSNMLVLMKELVP